MRAAQSSSAKILPRGLLPADGSLSGFIDLQVNGGGDVLFNNLPTPEAIATITSRASKVRDEHSSTSWQLSRGAGISLEPLGADRPSSSELIGTG